MFLLQSSSVVQTDTHIPNKPAAKPTKDRKVLIFNVADSYYHAQSVAEGSRVIELMGKNTGAYSSVATSDPSIFSTENLAQFDAVVLNNSTGNIFGDSEHADQRKLDLINFVKEGKGFIALHATTAFDNSQGPASIAELAYREMIGGNFVHHPWNYDEFSPLTIMIEDPRHPVCKTFGGKQKWLLPFRDEIFQFDHSFSRSDKRVLLSLSLEETADKGSHVNKDYPLAWIKNHEKGRVFYSAFGHSADTYQNRELLDFLLAGIQFAIGDLKASVSPVSQPSVDYSKGFVSIFNGQNLNGWHGEERIWGVENGAIVGQTTEAIGVDNNNFLIWEGGIIQDFELKACFKLEGEGGNSGIYFRSFKRVPDADNQEPLVGVQADFSADKVWVGTIMEYTLREKLAERGRKVVIKEDGTRVDAGSTGDPNQLLQYYNNGDWNTYHIIARDNLILLRINDVVMSEIRDYDKARLISGLLALQVHVGPPMKVQFKDIRIKKY
jgi:type 1 glutamine amidotransferase